MELSIKLSRAMVACRGSREKSLVPLASLFSVSECKMLGLILTEQRQGSYLCFLLEKKKKNPEFYSMELTVVHVLI